MVDCEMRWWMMRWDTDEIFEIFHLTSVTFSSTFCFNFIWSSSFVNLLFADPILDIKWWDGKLRDGKLWDRRWENDKSHLVIFFLYLDVTWGLRTSSLTSSAIFINMQHAKVIYIITYHQIIIIPLSHSSFILSHFFDWFFESFTLNWFLHLIPPPPIIPTSLIIIIIIITTL